MEDNGRQQKPNKGLEKSQLVGMALELGFIIAIPVIVFGLAGKWLDRKLGTNPALTLVGVFTAIIFTSIWIYRKFKSYMK